MTDNVKKIAEDIKRQEQQRQEAVEAVDTKIYTDDDRFNALQEVAEGFKRQDGLTVEGMKQGIIARNKEICDPPLTDSQLETSIFPYLYETGDSGEIVSPPTSLLHAEEKPIKWTVQDYIVEGELNVLAADGGVGKSTVAIAIAISVASGCDSFFKYATSLNQKIDLTKNIREPRNVLIYTGEDSISKVLKKRARQSGATNETLRHIFCRDVEHDDLSRYTFDSPLVQRDIDAFKPGLVIFDPVQEFVGEGVNMGSRNQMSTILNKLCQHGEKYGTAFLIVVHTNKRGQGASGRYRMADSSELWDRPRSVLIMGNTGEVDNEGNSIKYISCEKSNYCKRPLTVLVTLKNSTVQFVNTNSKTDKDYVYQYDNTQSNERARPQRDDAKQEILDYLEEQDKVDMTELRNFLKTLGFSAKTFRNAKDELEKEGKIKRSRTGGGKTLKWFISLNK